MDGDLDTAPSPGSTSADSPESADVADPVEVIVREHRRFGPLFRPIRIVGLAALVLMLWLLWSNWNHAAFLEWKRQVGPLPFFGAMAILPAIGFPVTPFFVIAGATFGAKVGMIGSMAALLINFTLCYWITQGGLRRKISALPSRYRLGLPNFEKRRDRALRFVLLVKFAPGVPAFVKNYILSLAGVPFGLYLVCSMLISGVYAFSFVVMGESVLEGDWRGMAIAAGILLAMGAAVWRLKRA
ncbi:MAG: TVP38/TMEM64 family protein [Phycisphaeraceae bacterium]|nr:TVP38/TMEM64 family protein [Phycisphaeraceae bacterium]